MTVSTRSAREADGFLRSDHPTELVASPIRPDTLSRRAFLGSALGAAAAVAGCGRPPAPAPAPPAIDVTSMLAEPTFHVAHRGGGGNWPEMTAYAYAQAAQVPGIRGLEISVCRSSDGVLVCSHDPTTTRTTDVAYTIADQSWSTLSTVQVRSASTTDPDQPSRPLAQLDEVAPTYIDRFVLFVEAKVKDAVDPLLARMAALGQPGRVVWKAPANSRTFAAAKALGFTTWGYLVDEPFHVDRLPGYAAAAEIDLLGAPRAASDAFIQRVSSEAARHGKITISWTIRRPEDEKRVVQLGCRGLMTSHPLDVLGSAR